MSFPPSNEKTYASIKFNGKIYRMFSNPINSKLARKLDNPYKNDFLWEIKDNKLYFENDIFANWVNEDLELLISKKPLPYFKREKEVCILKIRDGILKNYTKKTIKYSPTGMGNAVKKYMVSIGIFWIYDGEIFYKSETLKNIKEIKGSFDADFSHYEVWEEIKNQHKDFYKYEYEQIPRGRVIYQDGKFIVYSSKQIINDENAKKLILKAFCIDDEYVEFKEDEHYEIRVF